MVFDASLDYVGGDLLNLQDYLFDVRHSCI